MAGVSQFACVQLYGFHSSFLIMFSPYTEDDLRSQHLVVRPNVCSTHWSLSGIHTVTTTNIKTNMRHIHTYIVYRHLATRGNNKILHTLAALKRDFPTSLVAPLPNSEQTNLTSSTHTYTKSTPKHIHHHYAPSVTSTHTTHIISSTAPTYAPHCHSWICGQTPPE